MPHLFDPLTIRGVTLRNRIGISPMQQYCANADGKPTPWHLSFLVTRAAGGAGIVFSESTSVQPIGRVNYNDLGLWDDDQIAAHRVVANAVSMAGAVPAVQLGHGGRKACQPAPWSKEMPNPVWTTKAPSAVAFGDMAAPDAMTEGEIDQLIADYVSAARRAVKAGYRVVELHAAHGYLLHSFLSPISNLRTDRWGGDFQGRTRLLLDVSKAIRDVLPEDVPLSVRVSHTDWIEGGWTTQDSCELAVGLAACGVDIIDASSGGISPEQKIPIGPGYQVEGAEMIRRRSGLVVAAVGMITEPDQAQAIIAAEQADIVLLARASLREPHWPLHAASVLASTANLPIPPQFARGWTTYGALDLNLDLAIPQPAL